MRYIIAIAALLVSLGASAQKAISNIECNADKVVALWDNTNAPHSNEETKDEVRDKRGHLRYTSHTELYIYQAAKDKATGEAVVILPGGGYSAVCIEREGFKLAEHFKSEGITAIVVKYRLPNNGHKEIPMEDAVGALRYARKHAKKLGIDPERVGIVGSSAGGHLAASVATMAAEEDKPAFAILFYPVISGMDYMTHQGSFRNLLGKTHSPALREEYSLERRVSATTPPTILLLSDNDGTVPPINSIRFYEALKHHGVKASLHIYPEGGHGWVCRPSFRYAESWQRDLRMWLNYINKQ